MKRLFLFAASAIILASCTQSEKGYVINGTITGDSEAIKSGIASVIMANRDRSDVIRDTADIIDGKFTLKGTVKTPEMYFISIKGVRDMVPVFLENAKYTVNSTDTSFRFAKVQGGTNQPVFLKLNDKTESLAEEYDLKSIMREYQRPGTSDERKAEIEAIYDKYSTDLKEYKNQLISENPFSHFSLYQLRQDMNEISIDSLENVVKGYKEKMEFEGNKVLAAIEENLNKEKSLQIGNPSFDFTMNNPDGKPVTFSDIYKKNKVTMLDFWAGWCSPCRHFNPTLVKIYAQFHKKGFEVLGVSMDRERQSWLDAIKADKLTWPQVSDVNYWDCEPRHLYNINYIPQNVFVDQNGVIIGRKVAEEDIVSFLEEHLK